MEDDKTLLDNESPSDFDLTAGIFDSDDDELSALLNGINFQSSGASLPLEWEEPAAAPEVPKPAPRRLAVQPRRPQPAARKPEPAAPAKSDDDLDDLAELNALLGEPTASEAPTAHRQHREHHSEPHSSRREHSDTEAEKRSTPFTVLNVLLFLVALVLIAGIVLIMLRQKPAAKKTEPKAKILASVSVGGVNVGGMTVSDAKKAMESAFGNSYSTYNMFVVVGDKEIVLSPAETGAKLDSEAAAQAAYDFGHSGTEEENALAASEVSHEIDILPYLSLDPSAIRAKLEAVCNQSGTEGASSGYRLEGTMPALDADMFDGTAPCQTLVLTIGSPTTQTNLDDIMSKIMSAYSQNVFRVDIASASSVINPEPLDIDSIYQALYIAPVEAVEDPETHSVTPGSCGYAFSLDEARALLANAQYGDTVTVPMLYVLPEKLDIGNEFPEMLGSYTTEIIDNEAYRTNIELLCKAVDGTVIQPGTSFSFNDSHITLSAYDGYLEAPMHGNNCSATIYGGGADQFATAVHIAAMCADLTIAERHSGDHVNDYSIHGAEVSIRNGMDLRVFNSRSVPVLIRARLNGNQLVVKFMSSEPAAYFIQLESIQLGESEPQVVVVDKDEAGVPADTVLFEGINGGIFRVERVRTNKADGSEASRDMDIYIDMPPANRRIAK